MSVLDTQAVLYVWDQCFISDWNKQVLEDVCVALVLLLRRDFMEATDYHQMKQVKLINNASRRFEASSKSNSCSHVLMLCL